MQSTLVVKVPATMRSPMVATLKHVLEAIRRAVLLAAGGGS